MFCLVVFAAFANAENKMELVKEAYGSSSGSTKWNPEADLNGDGIVNIYDLALASKGDSVTPQNTYGPLEGIPTISVKPENTSVGSIGKYFSIDINVTEALATWAWGFDLKWNTSVLNITNITKDVIEGTFLKQGGTTDCPKHIDYNEGWVTFGCTLLYPATPQSGNGKLAIINFTVLKEGNSTLDLYNTGLLNFDLVNYTHEVKDGYFIVCPGDINRDGEVDNIDLGHFASAFGSTPGSAKWNVEADFNNNGIIDVFDLNLIGRNYGKICVITSGMFSSYTSLSIEPEKISALEATNTSFDVNLSMDYVENLYAYKFKLKYDPNVLSATGITYSYLNSPVQVLKNTDNSKGEIKFEINSYFGAIPKTGKGNLATVTFQVKDLGKTNIDVYSSKLGDTKKLVGHEVWNGFFTNYIPTSVDVKPDTLNLKNSGNWITAYINLPSIYNVSNIVVSSVNLLYKDVYVPASSGFIQNNTLVVKFDRTSLQSLLVPSDSVELTVKGDYLYNFRNVDFIGTDSIKVISK